MKQLDKIFLLLSFFGLFLTSFSGCKKEDPLPETERITQILTEKIWAIQTVTVDDTDQSTIYSGIQLSFTATGYTSTGGKAVWPASDTWSFTDETAKTIKRGDGVEVSIIGINSSVLVMEFIWTEDTFVSGRTESIRGRHRFRFTR